MENAEEIQELFMQRMIDFTLKRGGFYDMSETQSVSEHAHKITLSKNKR